jgi:cyclic pyranopterin phosphate synthase
LEKQRHHFETPGKILVDGFNRRFSYIRVSITDKCNFRCMYCMTHTPYPKLDQREILSYEEILKIVRIGTAQGISKVRITGGEPLIRKGLLGFLDRLSSIDGISDLSITTNGLLLEDMALSLKNAGIHRLNISLDSLKPERFNHITGVDAFHKTWKGIEKALALDFFPVKINVVALRGVNDDEFMEFANLTKTYPVHVRFIEYMPIGRPGMQPSGPPLLTPEIRRLAAGSESLETVIGSSCDGPARRFRFPGAPGELGFISPVSDHFCGSCNRIRLTASGQLRPCLLSDKGIDVAGPLREGCSDEAILDFFRQAASMKHERHRIGVDDSVKDRVFSNMFAIGG